MITLSRTETLGDFRRLSICENIFLLGIFLKQFYILPSGSIQLGDFCFMIAFGFWILSKGKFTITVRHEDKLFLLFVGLIALVNLSYTLFDGNYGYIRSILFYVFNLIVIISFREYMAKPEFMRCLKRILQAAILTQTFVYLVGLGRWFGRSRYEGTFNDPNQFGFYVLSAYLMIYMISDAEHDRRHWLFLALAFFLTIQSASTGITLGYAVFLVCYIFFGMFQRNKMNAWLFLLLVLICSLVFFLVFMDSFPLPAAIRDNFLYKRLMEKIRKSGTAGGIAGDRGWFLLAEYPEKMLYGAGEGHAGRFDSWYGEVHSSILGPLFNYGIIPFCVWMTWCFRQMKGIRKELYCVYLALFAESITLVNNRQPFFWMLFVLGSHYLMKKNTGEAVDPGTGRDSASL